MGREVGYNTRMRVGVLVVAAAIAASAGCATGSQEDDLLIGAGAADAGGLTGGIGGMATGGAAGAGGQGGQGGQGGTGQGGTGQGAQGGSGNAGGGGSGGGPSCDYDHTNTCPGAEGLGSVPGDDGGSPVVTHGQTSRWFVILIEETVGSIFEEDLSYTVELTSPSGMDWDLYVLEGPEDGDPDCNATPQQGQEVGNWESVYNSWDDDQPLGGEDDSKYLCIEVRYESGSLCGDEAEWTLTITGNT